MILSELRALPIHDYANLFPMLEEKAKEGGQFTAGPLTNLAADLEAHGCHTPVVLYKGTVLDGRNRIAAAVLAGLTELPTTEYEGDDPLMYVLSLNLHRRHLTTDQLVELGSRIREPLAERAKANSQAGTTVSEDAVVGRVSAAVAEALGGVVSATTLDRGWAIQERSPDLWRDVQRGARSVSGAYRDMQAPAAQSRALTAERFENLFDSAVSRISELIADYDGGADDIRYVSAALSNLIKQAEGDWA